MQFLLTAYDYTDADAMNRRLSVREKHLAYTDIAKEKGHAITGAAILDENEKMVGSILIFSFPSRKDLDKYLKDEPYITGKVWEKIEITPCKVGPTFVNN